MAACHRVKQVWEGEAGSGTARCLIRTTATPRGSSQCPARRSRRRVDYSCRSGPRMIGADGAGADDQIGAGSAEAGASLVAAGSAAGAGSA